MDQKLVRNGIVAVIAGIVVQIAVVILLATTAVQIAVQVSSTYTQYYYAASSYAVTLGMLLSIFGNLLMAFAVVYLTIGLRGDGKAAERAA